MARIVKEEERTEKRNSILAVAERLVYTRGYEQMTIQDILDDLQISKGAFYHYFQSKQAVLEALTERMQEQVDQLLLPIVHDPRLTALEKLQRFFPTLARWKSTRRSLIFSLMRILYADENAIFRQKARALTIKRRSPQLATIIRQGVQEGVLTAPYPDQLAEVVVSLVIDLGDAIASLLLSWKPEHDESLLVERTVAAYTDALERALGAPTGSLPLVDDPTLKEWFVGPPDNEAETQP